MTSPQKTAITRAARAATHAHQGQFRKNGITPFITHPARVAQRVAFFGGNHVAVIAAWLHDVMEDCENGKKIVEQTVKSLGISQNEQDEVIAIVSALTKDDAIRGKANRLGDTLDRINKAPPQATLIKLCDRLDNLLDEKESEPDFLAIYLPLTDQLIEALSSGAKKYGYTRALETLKAVRAAYS